MARENIPFRVNLRKNEVSTSKTYGQYYPEADSMLAVSLKAFARHVANHGKLASYDIIVLVLQNIVSCMTELIAQGISVKLDGLGMFYPTIEGVGSDSVQEAVQNLENKIKGIHLRFRPEGVQADGENLTSRAFKQKCAFVAHQLVKTEYKEIDGRRRSYQKRTPMSTYNVEQAEPDPEP